MKQIQYVGDSRQVDNETVWTGVSTSLTTKYLYDNASRVVCVAHPQVLNNQNSYDGVSYGVSYYMGDRTFFDAYGRTTEERRVKLSNNVTNALSYVTKYTYDRQGAQLTASQYQNSTMSPLLAKTGRLYDALGRVYQAIVYNPDNQTNSIVTNFYHDPLGNQVKVTDPNGHSTEYAFDKAGRQTSDNDALGNLGYRTYDPSSRVTIQETRHVAGLASPRREFTVNFCDRNGRTTQTAFYGANPSRARPIPRTPSPRRTMTPVTR